VQTLVCEARHRNLQLAIPTGILETAGEGIVGNVGELAVIVGGVIS
jgi:hypothetical protein